jgi:hypothetical protein
MAKEARTQERRDRETSRKSLQYLSVSGDPVAAIDDKLRAINKTC